MKRKIAIGLIVTLIIITVILFVAFNFMDKKGNIKNAEIIIGSSEIYTEDEIQSAINIVLDKFEDFPATLNKLWYDEEKSQNESDKMAIQYNVDEAIILYSNFETYSEKHSVSFNPNSEYKNWTWILVRNNNGEWQLKDYGY